MYNIKVYDREWNFIRTLNEKEISCEYSFWASVNWGYTTLKFDYYWDFSLDHKQRIKVYKWNQSIYQWFITWITKKADKWWIRQIITCSWLIGLLAFEVNSLTTINANPSSMLRGILGIIPWVDTSWIQEYP